MSRVSLLSGVSKDTFLNRGTTQTDPTIPLRTLLDTIKRHRSLQDALIVRIDSYRNSGPARHRFLILQLEREGRQQIWLRIDRRRDKSQGLLNFALNAGTSLANDRVSCSIRCAYGLGLKCLQAWFSADKSVLSTGLDPEHTMSFSDDMPTLGDLRWVFFAILQVLDRYKLFGVCAMFLTIPHAQGLILIELARLIAGSWSLSSTNVWMKSSTAQLSPVSYICGAEAKRSGVVYGQIPVSFSRFPLKNQCALFYPF